MRDHQFKGGEKKITPPAETEDLALKEVLELDDPDELLECVLKIRENRKINLDDPEEELRAAQEMLAETIDQAKQKGETLSFYAIRNKAGEMVATAKLNIYHHKNGELRGHLGRLTVRPDYRGQNIAKTLTDRRIEIAREQGCAAMDTNINILNAPALASKFNDGFVAVDLDLELDEDGERCFEVVKWIDKQNPYDKKNGPLGELKEVSLAEAEKIQRLLRAGWVGIDIKNSGDKTDTDPSQWILILEKVDLVDTESNRNIEPKN